jgi:phosphoglycerate dehydrogenase-like enzyme
MNFKLLLLVPDLDPSWPDKIRQAVHGVDVKAFADPKNAAGDIVDADAAYGTVPAELLARAKKLRWICAARAGLGGAWFYDALVKRDIIVTNMRGSYNEHLAGHAVAFLLAFARRFDHYLPQKRWQRGPEIIDLPEKTVLIVGVGGAGGEASKLCAALGMRVLGIDPRVTERPAGMANLATPDQLEERLGEADFVITTTPETPDTVGMFNSSRFARMKRGAYFINIARGRCVVTGDLVEALRSGHLAGAGLDVADPEPLPPDHPLWSMPNVLITPHVAIYGTPYREKWEAI